MSKCPLCLSFNDDSDLFCKKCGLPLLRVDDPLRYMYTNKKNEEFSEYSQHKHPESIRTEIPRKKNNLRQTITITLLLIIISSFGVLLVFNLLGVNPFHEQPKASTEVRSKPTQDHSSSVYRESNQDINDSKNIEKPEIFYRNGDTFAKTKRFFNGYGKLKISNGTNVDAVAKLVSNVTDKSILTIYIRRESDLLIDKIRDGSYKLYFALGTHYDKNKSIFQNSRSFSYFDEPFYFSTYETRTQEYIETHYSTFTVTLNPVYGGSAQTSSVTEDYFINL